MNYNICQCQHCRVIFIKYFVMAWKFYFNPIPLAELIIFKSIFQNYLSSVFQCLYQGNFLQGGLIHLGDWWLWICMPLCHTAKCYQWQQHGNLLFTHYKYDFYFLKFREYVTWFCVCFAFGEEIVSRFYIQEDWFFSLKTYCFAK